MPVTVVLHTGNSCVTTISSKARSLPPDGFTVLSLTTKYNLVTLPTSAAFTLYDNCLQTLFPGMV